MGVEFKHATLDNGLTIVAEVDAEALSSACGFFVKTGARDEQSDVMGVSHFLEHMMFKGTARRTADDVNREFDEIGARYNAFTTSEMTVFYAQVLPERLEKATDILGDILRPALREEDFETEKGVILEEIAMYMDQPFWVLYERVMADRYGDHPLGHRVLGTEETVSALSAAQMREYFNARYSADNTIVALAGAMDFERQVAQIEKLCGRWERTGTQRKYDAAAAADTSFSQTESRVHRCYQLMLTPAPGAQDDRRYAATMLAMALGEPGNSRLYWALVEPGLADEAHVSYDPHDREGDYMVYASCDPARADEVWAIVQRELAAATASVTADDLERLRNKVATSVTVAGERPGGRMQRLGRQWMYLGEHRTLEEELEAIERVTLEEVGALCEAYPMKLSAFGRVMPELAEA